MKRNRNSIVLKAFIINHFLPFIFALIAVSIIVIFISKNSVFKENLIKGKQKKISGVYVNLLQGEQAEIDFVGSIKNSKQLTLLGSSEFTDSPYCPYNFLPDSLGLQTVGFGHAYHQEFSILCELLAVDDELENSKIAIILSPGWFETSGTNTSAFIEFVRPNFLKKIQTNSNIPLSYKNYIGKYIANHQLEIDGITNEMENFCDNYLIEQSNYLGRLYPRLRLFLKTGYPVNTVKYNIEMTYLKEKKWNGNYRNLAKRLQDNFISSVTTNQIYVYDEYYTKHLIDDAGNEKKGEINVINLEDNEEMNDFLLLIKYMKSKNVKCSFIIQPLNPYYYAHLENFNPLIKKITTTLDDNNIPYLNLFVDAKDKYEPGTLNDIMHLGDYGWMKINYFLDSLYNEH